MHTAKEFMVNVLYMVMMFANSERLILFRFDTRHALSVIKIIFSRLSNIPYISPSMCSAGAQLTLAQFTAQVSLDLADLK